MLKLEGVSKTFYPGTVNEKRALNKVSLHLAPGDFATVVGSMRTRAASFWAGRT